MSKSTIQPLGDRVLVAAPPKEKANEEKIIGGIVIPKIASKATQADLSPIHFTTEVIAVGDKCERIKPGNRVVIRKPDCFVVNIDDVEHIMVREQHIVALLP
jgi:co-chaperonin GroES (HSP10)